MKTVIWLKTARVYSHNNDGSSKIERTTVKLEEGDNFNKFLRVMPVVGYMESEPPQVVKVLRKEDGVYKEIDSEPYQKQVDKVLSKTLEKPIDYKAEYDKLNERLKALESKSDEADDELQAARDEYKELFGKYPTSKMNVETIREKITEKLNS